jgi:hypothetical protein
MIGAGLAFRLLAATSVLAAQEKTSTSTPGRSSGTAEKCPAPEPVPGAPGVDGIVHRPSPAAFQLLTRGRDLYRARRLDEAEAAYRAAIAADPGFLGPRLNLATAACLRGRFADALAEASVLVGMAFVPWSKAIQEAADLAPLRSRPEWKVLLARLAEAGRRWGEAMDGALFFMARTSAPVRAGGVGQMVLDPKQEIFAWQPRTNRVLQVTAEDGRVLALQPSPDGRRILYLRGEKLVREIPAGRARLRGLAARVLDVRSMSVEASAAIAGEVERVDLRWERGPTLELFRGGAGQGERVFVTPSGLLATGAGPRPATARRQRGATIASLSGAGVVAVGSGLSRSGECRFEVNEIGGALVITSERRPIRRLRTDYGVALFGLPFAR